MDGPEEHGVLSSMNSTEKIDLGIEAYCWQSGTAGGLVAFGKLQQGYRTTAIHFVEFHFRPLYFTAAQVANIENFKTELSKYDSERKWRAK